MEHAGGRRTPWRLEGPRETASKESSGIPGKPKQVDQSRKSASNGRSDTFHTEGRIASTKTAVPNKGDCFPYERTDPSESNEYIPTQLEGPGADMEDTTSHVLGFSKQEKAPVHDHVHGQSTVEAHPGGPYSLGPNSLMETGDDSEMALLKPIETTSMDYVVSPTRAEMDGTRLISPIVRNLKKWKREARIKHSEDGALTHDASRSRKRKDSVEQGQKIPDSSKAKKQRQTGETFSSENQMAKAGAQPRQSP